MSLKSDCTALIQDLQCKLEHYDSQSRLDSEERNQLVLPFNPEELPSIDLMNTNMLNTWDYPIFDLAEQTQDTILSRVSDSSAVWALH